MNLLSGKFLQVSRSVYKLLLGKKRRLHLIPVKSSEKLFVHNSGKNLDRKILWHRTGNNGCSWLEHACHKFIFVVFILPYNIRWVMLTKVSYFVVIWLRVLFYRLLQILCRKRFQEIPMRRWYLQNYEVFFSLPWINVLQSKSITEAAVLVEFKCLIYLFVPTGCAQNEGFISY